MNYVSLLRSILQRAVSEESKPERGSGAQPPACCPPCAGPGPALPAADGRAPAPRLLPRSCVLIIDAKSLF